MITQITPPAPILHLTDIHRSYNIGTEVETEVLHGISISLQSAEFVALKGPSGSGKSTQLNIIGLLERLPHSRASAACALNAAVLITAKPVNRSIFDLPLP